MASTRVVPTIGATPTPLPTSGRPSARVPAGVPARRLAALGRQGAIALIPTALLVRLARVVAIGLVRKTLEVLATSVGRKTQLSPQGPTRA